MKAKAKVSKPSKTIKQMTRCTPARARKEIEAQRKLMTFNGIVTRVARHLARVWRTVNEMHYPGYDISNDPESQDWIDVCRVGAKLLIDEMNPNDVVATWEVLIALVDLPYPQGTGDEI